MQDTLIEYNIADVDVRENEQNEISLALSQLELIVSTTSTEMFESVNVQVTYNLPIEGAPEIYKMENPYNSTDASFKEYPINNSDYVQNSSNPVEAQIQTQIKDEATETKLLHKLGLSTSHIQKAYDSLVEQVRTELYKIFHFNETTLHYEWASV